MSTDRRAAKRRIIGHTLADLAVDILLPMLVTLVLTGAGVAGYLALTVSGVLVGAKAALGHLQDWRADRRAARVGLTALAGLAALFGMTVAGAPPAAAAATAGVITAMPVVASLVGRRRIDGFGLLVLAELAASVVLTLASSDPRFVLARPAVYTVIAGGYALATCRWGRPLMLDATKPMAAAGDPARAIAFEAAWAHSPRFRTIERAMTAGLGVALIAEALLRVVVVYRSAAPDVAVTGALAQAPAIVLIVLWFLAVRVLAVPRARAVVDTFLPADAPSEAPGAQPDRATHRP